ncbi:YbjQ family protein [Candidatus Nitrosopumilus sp. SW]|uniref:YbjQ family protein n=1 Tax=Candidatus Nitrosopumilus sp. SW TaxID=2508726 RepID=UPI001C8AB077|nr:YbjQ family protein [Candidatus Nitrosopumilus sp. SW]
MDDYNPENVLHNIVLMEQQEFGEKKKWKGIKKKLQKNQELDEEEYHYYRQIGEEYTRALGKKREWQLEKIQTLEEQGIGHKERWDELREKLTNNENLYGVDYEYLLAKIREFEQGVVTTTLDVEGREIVAYLGIVSGQTAIGLMFLKDWVMGLSDTFGGRSGIMERNFRTAKDEAIKQMTEDARRMGANAVVGVNVAFNSVEGKNKQMLMVIATGTAVITRTRK